MRALALLCLALVAAAGCALREPARTAPNLLANASFEDGRAPWFDFRRPEKPFWGSFEISDAFASEGRYSLRLALDSAAFPGATGISGAAQDVAVAHLPRRLSGVYRVDHWERGTRAQYVQLVVMVFGASNFASLGASPQLALVLAGLEDPPFAIRNRRFEFAGPVEPELGRWIPFDFDLQEQYRRHWGAVPVGLHKLRVFAEARFDGFARGPGSPPARALVHFDALRLGD
jgi:hypothetical protein